MKNKFLTVSMLIISLFAMPVTAQKVYHVNKNNGNDSNDGLQWSSAFMNIQPAIDKAEKGDTIKVAAGVYLPAKKMADVYNDKSDPVIPTNNRHRSFLIKKDILLYGGFPVDATNATTMKDRNGKKHETILSGDFNGDDGESFENTAENALHVIVMLNTTSNALLDGFYIMGGNAAADITDVYVDNILVQYNCGGGVYAITKHTSSPTLSNLVILDNQAAHDGGGVYNYSESGDASPKLSGVTMINNFANERRGGAFYNDGMDAAPILLNLNITGNFAAVDGGGVFCIAENNAAPKLENVLISGNEARAGGGVCIISIAENVSPLITNVTICGNKATGNDRGGGIIVAALTGIAKPVIRNSVVWGNKSNRTDNVIIEGGTDANPEYSYSLIEGLALTGTNLSGDVNPMFADPVDVDFAPTVSDFGDYRLLPESPLVNKGNNSYVTLSEDLDGQPRIYGDAVDIGAYELQYDNSGNEIIAAGRLIWSYQGNLYVNIGSSVITVRVFSMDGTLVKQVNNPYEGVYTFTSLPNGLYVVTLSTGETAKVLIK